MSPFVGSGSKAEKLNASKCRPLLTCEVQRDPESRISRRTLIHGLAIAAGATVVGASGALAQQGGELGPPTTITSPPRDFGPGGARTTYFWDPEPASSNAGRHVGYSGVTVWMPDGKLIGRIRLPEVCGNICFGGPKRNRLFMAASQSLYAVYTATQGAGPG